MCHIRVLICRVDDPTSDQTTELAAFDLPAADIAALQPETALDGYCQLNPSTRMSVGQPLTLMNDQRISS